MSLAKKDRLLNQLLAQLQAIKKMQDEGRECKEILIQVKAAKSLMNGFVANLIKEHMGKCIQNDSVKREKLEGLVNDLVNYS